MNVALKRPLASDGAGRLGFPCRNLLAPKGFEWARAPAVQKLFYDEFSHHGTSFSRSPTHGKTQWFAFLPFLGTQSPPYVVPREGMWQDAAEGREDLQIKPGPVMDNAVYGGIKHYSGVQIPRGLALRLGQNKSGHMERS